MGKCTQGNIYVELSDKLISLRDCHEAEHRTKDEDLN